MPISEIERNLISARAVRIVALDADGDPPSSAAIEMLMTIRATASSTVVRDRCPSMAS